MYRGEAGEFLEDIDLGEQSYDIQKSFNHNDIIIFKDPNHKSFGERYIYAKVLLPQPGQDSEEIRIDLGGGTEDSLLTKWMYLHRIDKKKELEKVLILTEYYFNNPNKYFSRRRCIPKEVKRKYLENNK